jgi:hypothetical protein
MVAMAEDWRNNREKVALYIEQSKIDELAGQVVGMMSSLEDRNGMKVGSFGDCGLLAHDMTKVILVFMEAWTHHPVWLRQPERQKEV